MVGALQADLDLLQRAALEAGALAMRFFRNNPASWAKDGGSPVTEADLAVDALLREDVPLRARPLREPVPPPPAADPPVLFSSCMVFDLSSVAIIASFRDPRVSTVTLDQGNVIIWSRFRKWISP